MRLSLICLLALGWATAALSAADEPVDWIDPATGHRVIRLSTTPGSSSLYFHQNTYTPEGDKLKIPAKYLPAAKAAKK